MPRALGFVLCVALCGCQGSPRLKLPQAWVTGTTEAGFSSIAFAPVTRLPQDRPDLRLTDHTPLGPH